MKKILLAALLVGLGMVGMVKGDLEIKSFDSTGSLAFNTLVDGTNYNYGVEWASSPSGPWSSFGCAGSLLDCIQASQGSSLTGCVPMCYRVVATLGDYLVVDLSGGTNAISYPINYYRTLADLPGGVGVNSDAFKTTNMVFRRIPAGSFIMGTPTNELGRQSNEPQHQVALTHPFYIGVFEVTQKQWERVMGTWPSYFTNESYRDSRPVESLSYGNLRGTNTGALWPSTNTVDMYSFMGRLRARTDKAFDLPTEAQWEYAGRAGTTPALNSGVNLTSTTDCTNIFEVGRYWFNGWGLSGQNADTTAGTSKVASYLPNAWGLYDMHGNALEWCLDWSGTYPDKTSDPVGALSGAERVQRGGSWNLMASECRIGYRRSSSPDASSYARGFRVALPSGQ